MSEPKKKSNPRKIMIFLGALTILFALYAVQAETQLIGAKEEIEKLNVQLTECNQQAALQKQNDALAYEEMLRRYMEADAKAKSK